MIKVFKAFLSGLSAKEKKFLYGTMIFVFIAILDRLILGSITTISQNLEEKIAEQTAVIKTDLSILNRKDKIMEDNKAYGIFLTDKGIEESKLKASFLSDVEGLANAAKVTITPGTVNIEDKKEYSQYSLTIECSGNMQNIFDFIYAIENSKKPIRVSAFQVSPKDRRTYDVKCTLTVIKAIINPHEEATP